MNPTKITLTALTIALSFSLAALADDAPTMPPASTKTGVTYDTDIKPIFDASCIKCHKGDHPKHHLNLDTLAGILKGCKDGPVIKPGDSANSDLVKAVAHMSDEEDDWMPPVHNKAGIKPLTPDQIGLIRAWIDQGAK